jgi:hypothetical protein
MQVHAPIAFSIAFIAPTLTSIAVYGAVLGIVYYRFKDTAIARELLKSSTPTSALTVVNSGGLYLVVLVAAGQYAGNITDFAYNLAAATCGLAVGTIAGIIISPSSKDESSEFSLLTKAVSTFLTGYILANLKDISKQALWDFLSKPGVAFRLIIGTACCVSTIGVVFVTRRAEVMKASTLKEWFISYAPPDPKHLQTLRGDVLARGPFASRDEALAEIVLIKGRDEFKGFTLTPIRVEIFAEQQALVNASEEQSPQHVAEVNPKPPSK